MSGSCVDLSRLLEEKIMTHYSEQREQHEAEMQERKPVSSASTMRLQDIPNGAMVQLRNGNVFEFVIHSQYTYLSPPGKWGRRGSILNVEKLYKDNLTSHSVDGMYDIIKVFMPVTINHGDSNNGQR